MVVYLLSNGESEVFDLSSKAEKKFESLDQTQSFIGDQFDTDVIRTDRLLAHITTDKPFYWPGEVIFTQIFLVDVFSKYPKMSGHEAHFYVLDGSNKEIFKSETRKL